jgi:1-aminocyclopropane-1-carboxylate deaminase/D-cysteine desulfhydrase-like pyridoxal-dependent ACC family enzyme
VIRVNALVERWPKLARLGRIELASLPTPVEPLPRISETLDSEIWVKRDDLTAARYGGNKVRKLEYLLAAAKQRGCNTLITAGSVGSHHVFATALYGRDHGFETYAALTPQPYARHVEDQLRAGLAVGAHLYPVRGLGEVAKRMLELSVRLRFWGRKPFLIPLGGSNVYGTLGFVNAGLELAQQIDAGLCPDIDAIYVAAGTCATVAGIALGVAAGGVKTQVIGARVTDRLLANPLRIAKLIHDADKLLRQLEPRFPEVVERAIASVQLDSHAFGEGYGRSTPGTDAARDLAASEGLLLDETYTAKAFACMLREAGASSDGGIRRGQKLLYWHTLSSASLEPFLREAPEAPERFVKLMTLG